MLGCMASGTGTGSASFGAAIRRVRSEQGVTQEELAERATEPGVEFTPLMISKIEREARKVTIDEALALARALNITVDELVGRQADLRAQYAALNREYRSFQRHVSAYALALLGVAVAADGTDVLSPRDREWLDVELERQTPSPVAVNAVYAVEAAIEREGINQDGTYVKRLVACLRDDADLIHAREHEREFPPEVASK
jgi:transcriptional regulator with XRE-family HTH domain